MRPGRGSAIVRAMPEEIATVTFPHAGGAEQAYGRVRAQVAPAPWLDKVAFVESHRHGRVVIRGTFAGHYIDIGDATTFGERDTEIGVVAGAIIGLAFGPVGLAVGLVTGGTAGALAGELQAPEAGSLFDELRSLVPEGASAIVLFAEPEDVEAMAQAFAGSEAAVVRHDLSAEDAAALRAAVASAPPAAKPGSQVR